MAKQAPYKFYVTTENCPACSRQNRLFFRKLPAMGTICSYKCSKCAKEVLFATGAVAIFDSVPSEAQEAFRVRR